MIRATERYRSGALRLLVYAGADVNLQNEVRYKVTMDTAVYHVSSLAVHIIGGSDGSDAFSNEWEDGADRYSTDWKRH